MSRRVVGVTLDNLEQLPLHCRRCVYWELAPHLKEQAEEFGETEVEKEAWVSGVLLEWGSCGRIIHSGDLPVGFVLYAPPSAVPRANAFPTSPASPDAVLLTAFHVAPEFRGGGLGRVLVQSVAKDLTRRGVRAIEAFGDADPEAGTEEHACVVPAAFLQSVGFKTVRPHPRWPRLRLELRSAISWKEDVEAALEKLLGQVTVTTATPSTTRA
ncbi:GNAT family N-acetyltransferase [Prauserella sp. PE36]|uniref:GNAT family N-acetyltransferase n=1 Tax=Prauserella endophytica TaxID=1592324 RepID=A0ABY2SDE7_9PSEU|nr:MULTISPECIES: GNAT family N-acetyltransferase [Prauserella]PXY34787.1 GCN5 family acetyltransferase [Prauserella coralliicola]RBM23675.1 GNAT family N-acetyltransferase [Prauserella sp. PE36]TKG73319.1 GNAT family N-acetyltransferase [Prauserella endophytica]